jgi:hypothetical protein
LARLNVDLTVQDTRFAVIYTAFVLDIIFGAALSIIHDDLICCEVCAFCLVECRQEEFQQAISWHRNYYWNKLKPVILGSPSTSVYSRPLPIGYLIFEVHKNAYRECRLTNDEEVNDTICTWLYLHPKAFFTDSIRKFVDRNITCVDKL